MIPVVSFFAKNGMYLNCFGMYTTKKLFLSNYRKHLRRSILKVEKKLKLIRYIIPQFLLKNCFIKVVI